ncbi:hypothetical protein MZC64_46250 [Crossiella sp. S99.2]|nr:hypothetical protein [Crossiella sp. S99.2]
MLAINNVTRGIEVQKYWNDVCDKVFARFLSEEFALTVYSTTGTIRPGGRPRGGLSDSPYVDTIGWHGWLRAVASPWDSRPLRQRASRERAAS